MNKTRDRISILWKVLALMTLGLTISHYYSYAGLPSQDPAVSALHDLYLNAEKPNVDRLYLTKQWNCTESAAVRDNFEVSSKQGFLRFVDNNVPNFVYNYGTSNVSLFGFRDQDIAGALTKYMNGIKMRYVFTLKQAADGKLIGEWLLHKDSMKNGGKLTTIRATIYEDYRVLSYLDCQLSTN